MKRKISLPVLLGVFFLSVSNISCSSRAGQIDTGTVSGTVTLDGKPLASGIIRFHPDKNAEGKQLRGKAVQVTIQDGKYSTETGKGAVVGTNKVFISVTKVVGKEMQDGVEVDKTEESLPAEYNTKTALAFEVKAGKNSKDFNLKSK